MRVITVDKPEGKYIEEDRSNEEKILSFNLDKLDNLILNGDIKQ